MSLFIIHLATYAIMRPMVKDFDLSKCDFLPQSLIKFSVKI
ncbi:MULTISPECIES: hypothetical protein [unclassified Campylobacter]|nr:MULTISPECIES: hypothetical protein [unclassified Campylobacter]MDA3081227.1 hypothetical protein [Campylobacter sp. CS_NA1]WBR51040.1 hypothetical protein PF026_06725 [Campylobacter sp. CS_NA3]